MRFDRELPTSKRTSTRERERDTHVTRASLMTRDSGVSEVVRKPFETV